MADPRPAHVHRVRVRPVDCDRQGIVHASRYPVFFEAAMVETLRSLLGSYKELEKHGVDFVMAETSIRYLSPARFDDLIRINVRVRTLGTTTLTMGFDADVDGTAVATGWNRYVSFGTPELRSTPIPDDFRRLFEPRRRPTEPSPRTVPAARTTSRTSSPTGTSSPTRAAR
ncbi:thioesterase family protein [Actinosynnema sp. NPDC047251]|uniref:Thioesterase superfamily protein n=1 Tax=Saccharothrix espanaensis (strain ATCC 51144 / DSM 44229 / JCM 9112 / NBRC 15066 / NRRL 15764) TaxID=1179773 RepID=K0JRT2_SACES|nr:thioesterase family protein [Saccharothrix espanaensis]CCH30385.1 Thioesterase superfamily protein [Saccharothrix espanaensis DSM 44229]